MHVLLDLQFVHVNDDSSVLVKSQPALFLTVYCDDNPATYGLSTAKPNAAGHREYQSRPTSTSH